MSGASVPSHRYAPGGVLVYGVGDRMTRRLAAVVVAFQVVVVLLGGLVAYAIAKSRDGVGHPAYLWVGGVLAVLCIVTAGTMRRPWGVALGWAVQIATLAAVFVVPLMFVVGVIFLALWITALVQGRKMDQLTADYLEQQP
ncbi:DUF4233 domain-containing protein [Allobranchiibius sp. CTAmp26]|uniref:DUF4233 domain-containing protein n=1 Tax=Allobranchiibius sp. CTAmp26 TaxID=2815214 RepID=UPI0027DE1BDE|nr:DUF4233 domain-containing protein [Allobranchiibius sp. CTAmp26]